MTPKRLRFVILTSVAAKVACLFLLLPFLAPGLRPVAIGVFGFFIVIQTLLAIRPPKFRRKRA